MSTKEKEPEEKSNWIKTLSTSNTASTIVVAFVAGMFALLGTTATSLSALRTERMKYEYDLVNQILSVEKLDENIDQKLASQRLQFLAEIGVIKSLNARAIERIAKSESLPSLPGLPSLPATQTTGGISQLRSSRDLSEVSAYIGECRQVAPDYGSIEIYSSTELGTNSGNRIGTINEGTDMILTGVVREATTQNGVPATLAQIYMPNRSFPKQQPVGWVDASKITECQE
jgi:hypothetical protein